MMHYDAGANTCNDASFNAEEFVNDTEGFGDIVGATIDSIHHMHIEIEEKEHIIEEMVTVLAVLPTENEAEMENVLEASNQISKEADALSDNVQDALLNVMDKISDKISHTDVNKSEPGKVENMVKSLFDSSSNLLDLNHVPERHIVKEKVIVEDKSETEDVIHVEETEPEQEVPYESPEEQQETQVQETEAEIKAREKKIERTKKLLHTVDIIADSALKTLSDDEPKTMEFSTKTMNLVVGVSKLNNSTNTSTDISTSRKIGNKTVTSSFKLPPEIKEQLKEASKNGFKFQMLFSDKNPRSWDKSSAYINSPMISLILKDLNQKTLGVTKLPKPIIIDIPIGRNEKYSEFILNSQEDNFIRLKVKQPANMFYMLKLMTDGPQYNMSVKIAIEFHKQVSLSDAENGTLISNTQIAFLKEPEKKSLYWSIGVIINDRSNGNISQNISVKISSTAINCRYWNNTIGKWVPEGCQVSPVSSSETLECECDHLTDFAGGVFVLPNIVDPFQDALLFLTFFDNPVVVTVVILVWLIYFLGLYRARQADRKDSNFDGIVTPFPSDPSDPFKYLMCIVTGWRYDARTTANVSCYIKGNNGQSARHCLSRTSSPQVLFTSGGEDWFLITSSYDIGDMVNVIVWHDNSGSSPSWFLSRIIIQDLQTKKVFNFYYDNWLGIQSGTAKVCLSIKSGYELKQQFFLRTSQDLRRGHLWISIISKPPCSNFTRAQRLSCALSLLFCTMLSCLMFHGIPTDETISSDVASIQFEFSLKDFIIGLESSIIMFPINFAIIELFVRSKTKQLHKERYMEIDVNRQTTSDEKGSDKTDNEIVAVKRWMFPWWVIYIAWTTTILTSLVSSYFVMLYGLKYGYYESLNWLVSFLTAFVDDVFLMEPINVVFFAMLFTFILKREIKIDSAPALIVHKPEKNNTLLQKRSNTKTIIPGHASKKDLKKAKQELDLKEKIQTNLQDIILYVFFTFMLLFVVHSHRPVEKCFMQSQDINNIFIQNTLKHVKTRGDIWTYINESVIPPLSRTIPYDMSKKIPENDFLLIGKFRLRQIRVKRDSCNFPDKLRKLFGLDHLDMKCTSTLNTVNDDNDNYNKSWQIQSQLVPATDEWSFQNAWDLESVPYLGERAIYGGGGYLVDMNTGPSSFLKISELMLKSWIDTRTRAFFIEFVLYNPNVNMYSSVMIVFEYSSPGTVTTSFQIYTTPLSHYSTSKEITSLVFEIVFFLLTIVVSYIEIKKIRLVGLKMYFKRFWNKLSMLMLILCYTSMAIFIERFRMITHIIQQYRSDGKDSYINFSLAILWDCILFYILALLTVIIMIKLLKLLMLNQKLKYLFSLMEHVKKPLKYFFFIYVISLLAFACCGHLLLGASLAGYRSFGDSLMVLIECTFRIVNYNQYLEFHPQLGPLFILLFIFIFVFGLMNMFTVIVMNAQKSLRQKGVKHDDQLTLLIKYFVQSIRRMFR
ncbi:polycystin-1-like protein 2 [Mytilus galloprovincialis]|uniref:polycystin-1-like protein 2 n=1 Tax=Mytilus galloprovincialis TaxID=29158 RepID=UPI003F7C91CB